MRILLARVTVAVALAASPLCVAFAQNGAPPPAAKLRAVTGTVTDKQGNTLSNAEVALIERDTVNRRAITGDNGRFRIDAVPSGPLELRVRRVGFQISRITVDASPLDRSVFIALDPVVGVLGAVNIDGQEPQNKLSQHLAEFHARAKSNRLGNFIDEQQLDALHPKYASDALRTIPGVVVRPSNRIGNDVLIGGCAPIVWIDGLRAKGVQIDAIAPGSDIAAIEVYKTPAGVPAQYAEHNAMCGTILFWLKER